MSTDYNVERFLEYVRTSRSKNTLTMYRQGLRRFTEWYGKTANEIIEERIKDWTNRDLFAKKKFAHEIEKFHSYLIKEKNYSPNSATYYCQGIRALFSFYEMPVKVSNELDKRQMTTKDYVPRIDQYAKMFKVADNLRDKLIVSLGLTLAWRISDFAKIKKTDLPNIEQETPIGFEIITQKEGTIAKSFLSDEVVNLLKEYLPTLGENPYLFPSNGRKHLDHTTFNRILKDLAVKAKLKIPPRKRLRFHCFRKRFLSECANLRIDQNIAKLLTGKGVEPAMLAYLSETDLVTAFKRISERLRLTEKMNLHIKTTDDEEISQLRARLDKLERKIHFIGLHEPSLLKKADEYLESIALNTMLPSAWKILSLDEKLELIAELEEKKKDKSASNEIQCFL